MPGTHNGPDKCVHGRSMKQSCSKCPRQKQRHTNEEIAEIGVVNLVQCVTDTVQAWRALGIDWPTIRSSLFMLKDQTDRIISECVLEDVKEKQASGSG